MLVARRAHLLWARQLCLAIWCAFAYADGAAAQAQTAVLEGTVQDTSGGIIANATVTLRNPETNQTRTALTDRQGFFRFTDVPVGTYEVRVDYDGFAPYAHAGLILAIGQTVRLNIAMRARHPSRRRSTPSESRNCRSAAGITWSSCCSPLV